MAKKVSAHKQKLCVHNQSELRKMQQKTQVAQRHFRPKND